MILTGFIQRFFCFKGQCFGQKYILSPIVLQTGYGKPGIGFTVRSVPIIFFAQIRGRCTPRMTGYIHFKSHVIRTFSGGIQGSEMGFPTMNRMITVIFQNLRQRSHLAGMLDPCYLTNPVHIPFGQQ